MRSRLVIAAQPDDESIGCGGMIKKYSNSVNVYVGMISFDEHNMHVREQEALRAAHVLNVADVLWANARCRPVQITYELIETVSKWIKSIKPYEIFIPHPNETDLDHAIIYEIVKNAIFRSGIYSTILLGYEIWTPMIHPHIYEDISSQMECKHKAIHCYESQIQHRDYAEMASCLNRYRAISSGKCSFVECFNILGL